MAKLYVVATPIGNRDDITLRALETLKTVDFVIAEDTRHSGQLLAHYGISKPLLSFRDAPADVITRLLQPIRERLEEGQSAAFVTDAGTPGVSDPLWRLLSGLSDLDVEFVPIPGASAVTALLSIVDKPLDEYRFVGFLPKKKGFATQVGELVGYLNHKDNRGVIFYESPNRIRATLKAFLKCHPELVSGSLYVVVGRELTKHFESIYRGALTDDFIAALPEKGEYVVFLTLK